MITEPQAVYAAARGNANLFREGFLTWLANPSNFAVWQKFEQMANQLWDAGRRHYSARTIGETLRFNTDLRDTSPGVKLNDWCWPDLARLYLLAHPDREGFFELRRRHTGEAA